jgi:hypothetical protein
VNSCSAFVYYTHGTSVASSNVLGMVYCFFFRFLDPGLQHNFFMSTQECIITHVDETLFLQEGVGSFTDIDDLAGTFSKVCLIC